MPMTKSWRCAFVAGLVAEGRTIINNAEQIERGYETFDKLMVCAKVNWYQD